MQKPIPNDKDGQKYHLFYCLLFV